MSQPMCRQRSHHRVPTVPLQPDSTVRSDAIATSRVHQISRIIATVIVAVCCAPSSERLLPVSLSFPRFLDRIVTEPSFSSRDFWPTVRFFFSDFPRSSISHLNRAVSDTDSRSGGSASINNRQSRERGNPRRAAAIRLVSADMQV